MLYSQIFGSQTNKYDTYSAGKNIQCTEYLSVLLQLYLPLYFWLCCFGENPRYCYSHCIVFGVVQKLTFCNISLITEDTCSKVRVCVRYPQSNPYYQGRQFIMHFFQNYASLLT